MPLGTPARAAAAGEVGGSATRGGARAAPGEGERAPRPVPPPPPAATGPTGPSAPWELPVAPCVPAINASPKDAMACKGYGVFDKGASGYHHKAPLPCETKDDLFMYP